jgi:hypothetical protein
MAYGGGDELRGIAGWLAFFVVVTAVLTPIGAVLMTAFLLYGDPSVAAGYGPKWPAVQLFEWLLTALTVAAAWLIVYRLVRVRTWSSVRITIACIWLTGLGAMLIDIAGIRLIADVPFALLFEGVGPDIVQVVVVDMIWTAYFLRSRRVANTYGRDDAGEDAAAVFG